MIHSDHGTRFTSCAFMPRALDFDLVSFMGTIGDCDNDRVMESF